MAKEVGLLETAFNRLDQLFDLADETFPQVATSPHMLFPYYQDRYRFTFPDDQRLSVAASQWACVPFDKWYSHDIHLLRFLILGDFPIQPLTFYPGDKPQLSIQRDSKGNLQTVIESYHETSPSLDELMSSIDQAYRLQILDHPERQVQRLIDIIRKDPVAIATIAFTEKKLMSSK